MKARTGPSTNDAMQGSRRVYTRFPRASLGTEQAELTSEVPHVEESSLMQRMTFDRE
jgi:hypothetical protein